MKQGVYKDHFCDGCEDFVNMTQEGTHFPQWHTSTWRCLSCGCLTHITDMNDLIGELSDEDKEWLNMKPVGKEWGSPDEEV